MPNEHAALTRRLTDEKITRATLALTLESGTDAVTIESVSQRSGVAKTTLYRRFANRDELLARVAETIEVTRIDASMAPGREGLTEIIRTAQAFFEDRIGLGRLGRLLSADSAFLALVVDRLVRPQHDAILDFFRRGARSGVFRADADYAVILDAITGSMVIRDALTGDVPDAWPEQIVAALWPSIAAREGS
jgi:AcrR family transcriptional regulator